MAQPTYNVTADWEPFMQTALNAAIPEAKSNFDQGALPVGTGFYTGENGVQYAVKAEYTDAGHGIQLTVREA